MQIKPIIMVGIVALHCWAITAHAENINSQEAGWNVSASARLFFGKASGSYDASGGFVAPMLSVSALHSSGWFASASAIENMSLDYQAYGSPGKESKSDREIDIGYVLSPNVAVAAGIKNIEVKSERHHQYGYFGVTNGSNTSGGICPNFALALRTKLNQTLGGFGNFSAFAGCNVSENEDGGNKKVRMAGGAIEFGLTQSFSDKVAGLLSVRYMPYSGSVVAFKHYYGITAGVSGQF